MTLSAANTVIDKPIKILFVIIRRYFLVGKSQKKDELVFSKKILTMLTAKAGKMVAVFIL